MNAAWVEKKFLTLDEKRDIKNSLKGYLKNTSTHETARISNLFVRHIERCLTIIESSKNRKPTCAKETWDELLKRVQQVQIILGRMTESDGELFYFSDFQEYKALTRKTLKDLDYIASSYKGFNRGNPANGNSMLLADQLVVLWQEHIGNPRPRGSFGDFCRGLFQILEMENLGIEALSKICNPVG